MGKSQASETFYSKFIRCPKYELAVCISHSVKVFQVSGKHYPRETTKIKCEAKYFDSCTKVPSCNDNIQTR